MKQGSIRSPAGTGEASLPKLALTGTMVVFSAYAIVLSIGHDSSLRDSLPGAVANTVPTVLFGLIAFALIRGLLRKQRFVVQASGHILLCAAFTLLSYWLLLVMLGAVSGVSVIKFNVEPFPVRASVWQMLENATVYGMIAALAYRGTGAREGMVVLADSEDASRPDFSRYFIRRGDEIQPIDVNSIVSITGADDYAEVVTVDGKHLVRMTLADFEKSLDPARFIRAHRSHIVNVERIVRAEPAGGGRLLLHLDRGETIPASRTGSRLLRDRVI
jgi:two-component system LytT family response regulator